MTSHPVAGTRVPACFGALPGAVLQLSPDGVVLESNGRLESDLGRGLVGTPFAQVLDPESCTGKWARVLAADERDGCSARVWELILVRDGELLEPRPFSILWDSEAGLYWAFEHRPDPRLDRLSQELAGVNSELANTQRDLLKERGRLAHALTELRARGEELERSNQALDEFAHVVSHDLKAPLRGIDNLARWIQEDPAVAGLRDETRGHLDRLRDRVGRLRAMISGVLAYARAGREDAAPERVDVAELLREVVEILDPAVVVQAESPLPELLTDRAPLRQVILNLVDNAVKYAARSPSPLVGVGCRVDGDWYEFYVRDNGPGIPEHLRERVWTLFHTLEPEESGGGTGIGLAVVRKLVEARGGRARVGAAPGAGAEFRFTWPASPGAAR